jgi:hypothetical protein
MSQLDQYEVFIAVVGACLGAEILPINRHN